MRVTPTAVSQLEAESQPMARVPRLKPFLAYLNSRLHILLFLLPLSFLPLLTAFFF
jgi:hypothetical protein